MFNRLSYVASNARLEHETHVGVCAVGICWVYCAVMYALELNPNVGLCTLLYIRKLQP
jgi:hypothetical protein